MTDRELDEISGCGARRGFGGAASIYEPLASLFSYGLIAQAKRHQLSWLKSGSRVLFLGVGAGEDALLAAQRGAHLTCLDISPGMLGKLRTRLDRQRLEAELICGDAWSHDRTDYYDSVVCNFFLNCFDEPESARMLAHAASLTRDGGTVLIADVAVPRGNPLTRAFATAYIKTGMIFFWLLGMVKLHGIHDYRRFFPQAQLELIESTPFRLAGFGPVVYETLVARRISGRVPEHGA